MRASAGGRGSCRAECEGKLGSSGASLGFFSARQQAREKPRLPHLGRMPILSRGSQTGQDVPSSTEAQDASDSTYKQPIAVAFAVTCCLPQIRPPKMLYRMRLQDFACRS